MTLEIWMGEVMKTGMVFGILIYAAITLELEFRDENQIKTENVLDPTLGHWNQCQDDLLNSLMSFLLR